MLKVCKAAIVWLWCATPLVWAQVTNYDAVTSVVTIPSVSVGAATFTNVTLKNRGNFVFDLQGATEQVPVAGPGTASYDAVSGVLTMPAVKVGDATFLDVKLLNIGNFVFTLQAATPLPQSLADDVATYLRQSEAVLATEVPATGAARLALADGCWRNNGRTRANFIADWDANSASYRQRDAFLIGRLNRNAQVLAVRDSINADGSARREIDVQFDIAYRDGSTHIGSIERLIGGSSAGTPGCTTPQAGTVLRVLGNQQLVQTAVRANNLREQRYNIANGAALAPAVRYRREVGFQITDPMGNATYLIVRGPGPSNTIDGVVYPFSMKFISPQLLKSAPELQGKPGNFLNWLEDDSFLNCSLANGQVPVVHIVDCVAQGATANHWGIGYTDVADAATDVRFIAQGWVAGGLYRFDVYNDDGWKSVNGHANKTPVATYYAALDRLPYSFVEMAGKYPVIDLGGLSPVQVATNANSATPAPLALSWSRPGALPGPVLQLFQVTEFHQGAKIGNPGTTFNPAYRTLTRHFPGTLATATSNFPVTPRLADQSSKTYTEYSLFFSEPGTFNSVRSRINFQ